ncbi:DUF368 domain-containing protein [Marichromatium gracile]|nr:DUF368 domain-containing protein [Marichromatium gracile]
MSGAMRNPPATDIGRAGVVLRGAAMGVAEIIPGVSGGTIAFVSGIYERLIEAIRAVGPGLIGVARREGVAGVWRAIDGNFLTLLLAGMVVGLLTGLFTVSWLLEHHPPLVWGFFFGLILASILHMARRIERWDATGLGLLVLGAAFAYALTVLTPAQGSEALWFVFCCGVIAISALILPGISGSFMLLLLGMYQFIIHDTLKGLLVDYSPERLLVLGVFALGCVVGLMTLSRLLSWTFHRFHAQTLALLTGFLVGSLNKIYPWRNPVDWLRGADGQVVLSADGLTPHKIIAESNVLPGAYHGDPLLIGTLVACLLGILSVLAFERLAERGSAGGG